ncbi:TonB-dependent receptor domain-containing protein [Flavitalea flava]
MNRNWLCLFALLALTIRVQAQSLQEVRLSINFPAIDVGAALRQLKEASPVNFAYDASKLNLKRWDIPAHNFEQARLSEVLEFILKKTSIGYKVVAGSIVLYEKEAPAKKEPALWHRAEIRVTDARTGRPLEAVTVEVAGEGISTMTDAAGKALVALADTTDRITLTMVGYAMKILPFTAGGNMEVQLRPDNRTLGSVTVEAHRRMNLEAALLNERRNAAVISDGISAQNIERTASITTTQALQRVVGVTITDDKYVAIRGMGDRNVIAELNGARLSATNTDRNAVPLDLVPAALLDNITIYKSVTPDKAADAPAGIVELKTKSVPDSLTITIAATIGSNTTVGLGGNFNSFYNADPGFFGQNISKKSMPRDFTDLAGQYPGGGSQMEAFLVTSKETPRATAEAKRINGIMHRFDPVLNTSYRNAQPNQIYTATFGNTFRLLHGHKLGIILGGNYYRRTSAIRDGTLTEWSIYQGVNNSQVPPFITPDNIRLGKALTYTENTGTETINYGVLAALTYRFSERHEISMHFIGNRGAEVTGSSLTGYFGNTGLDHPITDTSNTLRQTSRTFNTLQFRGEHKLGAGAFAPRFSWNLSGSHATQDDPDYRYINLRGDSNVYYPHGGIPSDESFVSTYYYQFLSGKVTNILPGVTYSIDPNGRRFRHLAEDSRNYTADLSIPFQVAGNRQVLKMGGYYLKKDRVFTENILGLPGSQALYYSNGDLNRFIGPDKIALGLPATSMEGQPPFVGFLYSFQKDFSNYSGSQKVGAIYSMLDLKLNSRMRLVGGVRFESTDISGIVDTGGIVRTAYKEPLKPYFSGNIVYKVKPVMNLRLAYSSTLARPEIRELMPVVEFDPLQFAVVSGNPNLKNQLTNSYDLRWEWFTGPGEVMAISLFGKTVKNQLTKIFLNDSLGVSTTYTEFNQVQFINDTEQGSVYGAELEFRKGLGRIAKPLKYFFIAANLMLAHSEINKNSSRLTAARSIDRTSPAKSPLFEQPPYSLNFGLDYDNPRLGSSAAVNFNRVGERLIQVNLTGEPDIYDQPASMLDLVFSQRVGRHWQFKGFAKNILDPAFRQVYTNAGEHGQLYGHTYTYRSYHRGAEIVVGVAYNVF